VLAELIALKKAGVPNRGSGIKGMRGPNELLELMLRNPGTHIHESAYGWGSTSYVLCVPLQVELTSYSLTSSHTSGARHTVS
jgi:hypothetical protein